MKDGWRPRVKRYALKRTRIGYRDYQPIGGGGRICTYRPLGYEPSELLLLYSASRNPEARTRLGFRMKEVGLPAPRLRMLLLI